MSLINDALKRAAADKPRDAQASAPAPMQPVEAAPSRQSPLLLGGVLLLGVGAVGIAAALWFGGKSTTEVAVAPIPAASIPSSISNASSANPQVPEVSSPKETRAIEPAAPAKPVLTAAQVTPAAKTPEPNRAQNPVEQTAVRMQAVVERNDSGPTPIITPSQTPVQSAPQTAKSPSVAAAPSVATTPTTTTDREPRLQSIFYRLRGPTVIINGKTLKTGDSVDGIKVMSIQRTSVEVMQNGKYRTLTLQH